jgi:hypothetical protein
MLPPKREESNNSVCNVTDGRVCIKESSIDFIRPHQKAAVDWHYKFFINYCWLRLIQKMQEDNDSAANMADNIL